MKAKHLLPFIALLAIATLTVLVLPSPAMAEVTVTQISSNASTDAHAEIDGNHVVWHTSHAQNQDSEVWLYDTSTTDLTRVWDHGDPGYDIYPQVHGNYVAWSDFDGEDFEVYLYDISSGLAAQLTDNNHVDYLGDIDADHVVWWGYEGVHLYDLSTRVTTQLTNNGSHPQIDGNHVVWEGRDGGDYDIFLYSVSTGLTTQLTVNENYEAGPQIDGKYVVWAGSDGGQLLSETWEIYLYDIDAGLTTQVTDDNFFQGDPRIDGDHVVWDWREDESGLHQACLYSISTGDTTRLTNNDVSGGNTAINGNTGIDGNRVIYAGAVGSKPQVYLYDIVTKQTIDLSTNSSGFGFDGEIDGNQVVWVGADEQDSEIYLATLKMTIDDVLSFFEKAVADGTLVGNGPGKSAKAHLRNFESMLLKTKADLDKEDTRKAITKLERVYLRCDELSAPPDLVRGSAADGLANQIQQLINELSGT